MRSIYLLTGLLIACTHSREPATAGAAAPADAAGAATPSAIATTTGEVRERSPSAQSAHLAVEQVEGVPAPRMRAIFEPALEPIRRCFGDGGGKLDIRLTNRRGVLDVVVEPGPSLDPRARACVLDALTAVYLQQTASNAGGPNVPPSGFTSIVTVSW